MIFTIGGIKGGSGKSTVATNLAVMFARDGGDVLLIDADDQETATDFTHWRSEAMNGDAGFTAIQLTDAAVRTQVLKLAPKYDHIIIDTGGRDTTSQRAAISVTDLYLVPFIPRSFDVWTLEKVIQLIEEIKAVNPELLALAFINRADPRGSDNQDAAELLADTDALQFIDTPLGNRKAFSNAAASGLGVIELKPADPKASHEVTKLFEYCKSVAIPS